MEKTFTNVHTLDLIFHFLENVFVGSNDQDQDDQGKHKLYVIWMCRLNLNISRCRQIAECWQSQVQMHLSDNYRQPCVATQPIMFCYGLFFYFYFYFFIHRSFTETTQPILTKFSGIVYSGVVWIIW